MMNNNDPVRDELKDLVKSLAEDRKKSISWSSPVITILVAILITLITGLGKIILDLNTKVPIIEQKIYFIESDIEEIKEDVDKIIHKE